LNVPSKSYVLYILLVIGVLVLLNLPSSSTSSVKSGARDNLAPFHKVVDFVASSGSEVAGALREIWFDPEDERELLKELAQLRRRVSELEQLETENDELRRLAEFSKRRAGHMVMCKVISRGDASGWWEIVRLNRGAAHRIRPGMAVISADGLVGRTTNVSKDTSDVLLLTDPLSKVSCRLNKSGAFGIVKGQGVAFSGRADLEMITSANPARIDYLSADKPVYHGEEVRTSGLGGVYPEGLLVGRIGNIRTDDSQLYLYGEVTPAADLGGLKYLFVVMQ
jgi:rod shape-determining protein MreC